ncbi:MAG: response regulator transcription factor [Bacteroidetes bacterium]|nr:response regulator transcription factor [Bacteroidota bacterium]
MSIKVIIVEDNVDVNQSLVALLNGTDTTDCIASFENAEDFSKALPDLSPDVVLMDIHLPGNSGIDCIRAMKPLYPQVQYLIFSIFDDVQHIFAGLEAGACGYILKTAPFSELLAAIQDIHQGGSPMSGPIARKVVQRFQQKRENVELQKLSPREQELLALLSKGFRYKEIADQLSISIETVRKHVRNIYEKLQVQSRTDALNKVFGSE